MIWLSLGTASLVRVLRAARPAAYRTTRRPLAGWRLRMTLTLSFEIRRARPRIGSGRALLTGRAATVLSPLAAVRQGKNRRLPGGSGQPSSGRGSTAGPGSGKALGSAGVDTAVCSAEPRRAGLFQSAEQTAVSTPISGPETAFP